MLPLEMARGVAGRAGRWVSLAVLLSTATAGVAVAGAASASAEDGNSARSLYVSTTGSDAANSCTNKSDPCQTIQHAILQAETLRGGIRIHIAAGTYTEQVTVAPTASSKMTSLVLEGSSPANSAIVKPDALHQNVCEGATGNFFDDNTGPTAAIIGVETGVSYVIRNWAVIRRA